MEVKNAIVLHDPRFAQVQVPGLVEEITYLKDEAHNLEDELNKLKLRLGRLQSLETLEAMISFQCPAVMKKKTIIACRERRRTYSCVCDARRLWIERYIL